MADLLTIGTSALLAYRQALDTAGHNIANANTPGFTRQRVELVSRPGSFSGSGFIGSGVGTSTVRRLDDQLIVARQQGDASSFGRAQVYATLADRLDGWLSNSSTGLSAPLNDFYASLNALATNPASSSARQAVLGDASTLTARLTDLQSQVDGLEQDLNSQLRNTVEEVNTYADQIAKLNDRIAAMGGQPPNDLLDQRELLVLELATRIGVSVVPQDDGTLSIFTGSGQGLVLGKVATPLSVAADEFNSGRLDITIGAAATRLTSRIGGGVIGGLLDARREVIDPARAQLGLLAAGLAESLNSQHALGMDQYGALGGDFFTPLAASVSGATANAGSGTVSAALASVAQLTGEEYALRFDGAAWQLTNARSGAAVAMSGTGTPADPFSAAGLSIVVGGAPAAGDRFLIQPTAHAAGQLSVAISDPARLAAASPLRTSANLGNTAGGSIGSASVLDPADPALLNSVTIRFTSSTTYEVNGAGSFAYTPGANIDINGWRVQVSGAPATGDEFRVQSSPSNSSDNSNARALANLATRGLLDTGRVSVSQASTNLVARVGQQSRQAGLQSEAQATIRSQTMAARESVSGVNLDEEAADLMRFQQAYQAAARVIQVADTVFQTLLDAARG